MSKVQDGFLGKVSKGIKKTLYDDEPDATPGSLIIERLQSLAGSALPGPINKAAKGAPDSVSSGHTQYSQSAKASSTAATYSADADRIAESASEAPTTPEPTADSFPVEDSASSENADPMRATGPMATILVVEDDIVSQRLMRKILEERGYDVIVAEDGVDALMALGKINFDLILCDINMPNLDGFTLMEFLNKKEIFIPVIFITVREDVEDEIRGLALGAKDYIRKPINRDLLLLRIRKALDR
jgi:CheY-like chemotaxis protein